MSSDKLNDFTKHIIDEEILADRYATYVYYKLNGDIFPKYRTQQLYEDTKKESYEYGLSQLHGIIKDEDSYNTLMMSFII